MKITVERTDGAQFQFDDIEDCDVLIGRVDGEDVFTGNVSAPGSVSDRIQDVQDDIREDDDTAFLHPPIINPPE